MSIKFHSLPKQFAAERALECLRQHFMQPLKSQWVRHWDFDGVVQVGHHTILIARGEELDLQVTLQRQLVFIRLHKPLTKYGVQDDS
jgi:hypothetical protein